MKLFLLLTLSALPLRAQEKPATPLAACIEPAIMRTDAAQLLPGSKKTVIVPAREDALGLSRLTKEEFAATGLKWNQFLTQAAATAATHLKSLKPDIHRDKKGTALYAVLKSDSHLTASVILCPEFYDRFKGTFGDRLVVLVPDRFTVYVFPRGFSDFQTMGPTILEQHAKSVWPCSQEAFEVTSAGLKCLGAFDTGEAEEPAVPAAKSCDTGILPVSSRRLPAGEAKEHPAPVGLEGRRAGGQEAPGHAPAGSTVSRADSMSKPPCISVAVAAWPGMNSPAQTPEPVLAVSHLRREFENGALAVADLSFEVRPGEVVGLLGANGAGKTTAMHIILGLMTPTAGTVRIFGMDPLRDRVAILRQCNFASAYTDLPGNLLVWQNLTVFGRIYGVKNLPQRITELLELFEIGHLRKRVTGHLSAGESTRLQLCKSLLNTPRLLMLDEPTASLDPDIADKVRKTLRRVQQESGIAILYTSHNMRDIEEVCDRVLFMHKGKVVTEGSPREVVEKFKQTSMEDVFIRIVRDGDIEEAKPAA